MKSGPCLPQLEKALAQKQRPNTAKNKNKLIKKTKTKTEYTFISSVHGTFSRTDHILGHKTNFNKFNRSTEIISSIFSDHNGMKLEINNRKETRKKDYMETKYHATKTPMGQ